MKRQSRALYSAVCLFLGFMSCSSVWAGYYRFVNIGAKAYSSLSLTIPVGCPSTSIYYSSNFQSDKSWLRPSTVYNGTTTGSTISFDIDANTDANSRLAHFTGNINGTDIKLDFVQAGTATITPVTKTVQVASNAQTAQGVVKLAAAPFTSQYVASPSGWVLGKNITVTTHEIDPRSCQVSVDMPANDSDASRTVTVSMYRDDGAQLIGTVVFTQVGKPKYSETKTIGAGGGSVTFDMTLQGVGQYGFNTSEFTYSDDWFWKGAGPSIKNNQASITFDVAANTSAYSRTGVFTGTINGNSLTLTISQEGASTPTPDTPSTPTSDFGPGNASEFYISQSEKAFVVGVYDLHWSNFAIRSDGYYAYTNPNIVDREKSSGSGAPDHSWCVAYSIVNAAIWGGWGYLGGYGYDEDLFGDAMIESGTAPDYYSSLKFVVDVLVPETIPYQFNEVCDSGFAQALQDHFANAEMMLVTRVYFDNYNWYGTTYYTISHGVACCGYSLDTSKAISDPTCLKGLFIIDSDNDRETSGGGSGAPNTMTYCPVSWDASRNRYNISNVFGTTGYLSNEDDGATFFFQCRESYSLRKTTEPVPAPVLPPIQPSTGTYTSATEARTHAFGTVGEAVGRIEVSPVGIPTQKMTYNAVVRDALGQPAGIVSVSVGKASNSGQSSVKATFIGLDGKKKNSNSVKVSMLQSGATHVTLFVKDYGTLELALGADSVAGTLGKYDVLPARVGGSLGTSRSSFNLENFNWTGSTKLLGDYLPTKEVFVSGNRWVFDKAAVVKYKQGVLDQVAYEKGLSDGKTNKSGLKLTYNARSGTFKGNFMVYSEDNSGQTAKLKKTRVTVTGVVADGYGYGQAVIRNGGTFPVTISPVR